jgi:hypothetical protein
MPELHIATVGLMALTAGTELAIWHEEIINRCLLHEAVIGVTEQLVSWDMTEYNLLLTHNSENQYSFVDSLIQVTLCLKHISGYFAK